MRYTKSEILKQKNAGKPLEFLAFWGHKPAPGRITKSCLSQWYDCTFCIDGRTYHTAEQYMMSQKALLFGDEQICSEIMNSSNPKDYKALGRKVKNYDDSIWNQHKYGIVLKGNIAKFSQNPDLWEFLDSTGDCILVEASPYDGIWGVRFRANDSRIQNPGEWQGENLLGFALMEARDVIRERQA